MNFGFRLFVDIAPIATVMMILSLAAIYPYRKEPAAQSLLFFIFFVAWLLVSSTAELLAPVGFWTVFFAKLEYLSFSYIPVCWLSFSLRYSGWITYTRKGLLATAIALPGALFALALTNEVHGLLWSSLSFVETGNLSVLRPDHGPLFWLILVYSWLLIGLGTVIIIRSYFFGQRLYYRQSLWILGGTVIPALANALNVSGLIPGLSKDFTPIAFALSALCFLAGMYFHRLLWIMPVARGVILQELPIGVLVLDSHGWIVDHNQRADELFGLDLVSVGRSHADFPALVSLFAIAGYSPGQVIETVRTGQAKIGATTLAWTIKGGGRTLKSLIVTVEDITEALKLQTEAALIKTEFIRREKMASVGQLTAGLAHEINNPLGYLKSDVRCLERLVNNAYGETESANAKEIVAITGGITEGLDRIENVVGSLLSFSRQGSVESAKSAYGLQVGIDTTLEVMRSEYQAIARVDRQYGDTPSVIADKNEINQVLFNILSNAVQAIKDRHAREGIPGMITIRTGRSDDSAFCEIENNGTPIPTEVREKLFELFFTTKPEKWGTGLGLHISRDIIEQRHGGRLSLLSADPVVFRIELPAAPA